MIGINTSFLWENNYISYAYKKTVRERERRRNCLRKKKHNKR